VRKKGEGEGIYTPKNLQRNTPGGKSWTNEKASGSEEKEGGGKEGGQFRTQYFKNGAGASRSGIWEPKRMDRKEAREMSKGEGARVPKNRSNNRNENVGQRSWAVTEREQFFWFGRKGKTPTGGVGPGRKLPGKWGPITGGKSRPGKT